MYAWAHHYGTYYHRADTWQFQTEENYFQDYTYLHIITGAFEGEADMPNPYITVRTTTELEYTPALDGGIIHANEEKTFKITDITDELVHNPTGIVFHPPYVQFDADNDTHTRMYIKKIWLSS